MFTRFVANSENCRKYAFLGGPPRLLRYYKGASLKFITILQGGGCLPDLLQYYKGEGGVSRDPQFVLRNIWTAPKLVFGNNQVFSKRLFMYLHRYMQIRNKWGKTIILTT